MSKPAKRLLSAAVLCMFLFFMEWWNWHTQYEIVFTAAEAKMRINCDAFGNDLGTWIAYEEGFVIKMKKPDFMKYGGFISCSKEEWGCGQILEQIRFMEKMGGISVE